MTKHIVAPKFTPPKFVKTGDDGIPNYVVSQRGQKHCYTPPNGFRLAVFFNGTEMKHVTEADRTNGYVRACHVMERGDGTALHLRDDDGNLMYRMYERGDVRFQLVPLRPMTAPKGYMRADRF